MLHCSLLWTSCLRILTKSPAIPQQHYKTASRGLSAIAELLVVSPGDAPVTITQYVARMERQFNACQTPRRMYLSIFNSFRVIRSLSHMRKSKNRYFYHIFVSPGYALGAITLNVVWMEREFDAYKLSRCMCPSNYNCFWHRARYLWKSRHFIIHPCIRRPR